MYPLDFEEFLYANGFNELAINTIKEKFLNNQSLDENMHNNILDLFKKYLLIGDLLDAVNSYLQNHNIVKIRVIQDEIYEYYGADATTYEKN